MIYLCLKAHKYAKLKGGAANNSYSSVAKPRFGYQVKTLIVYINIWLRIFSLTPTTPPRVNSSWIFYQTKPELQVWLGLTAHLRATGVICTHFNQAGKDLDNYDKNTRLLKLALVVQRVHHGVFNKDSFSVICSSNVEVVSVVQEF